MFAPDLRLEIAARVSCGSHGGPNAQNEQRRIASSLSSMIPQALEMTNRNRLVFARVPVRWDSRLGETSLS